MNTSNRRKVAAVGLEQFKRAQRQVWEEGDYRPVGRLLKHAAHILVDQAAVTPGQRVLDVATGSGTVAVAAAQAGGNVLGIDITDAWFADARQAAVEAGVDVQLEVGDAEDLPVADAAFDVVLSGFGAIFAPRHELVAAELTRACRPGGTIAFTAWTPGGKNDRMFSMLTDYLPAPPEFVTPYIRWGDPEHVRAVFAPHAVAFTFERPTLTVEFPSAAAFESFMLANSGGAITARRALEALGRWHDAYAALHEAIESLNEASDGSYRVTWDFLLAVGARSR
jgi:SAM-dependent methyltransferase